MSVIRYLFVSTSLGLLKPLSILLFTCAIVTGCGGGGSSSPGSVPTSPAPDQNPTPDLDSHNGTDFDAGVFQSSNLFKHFCGDPRQDTAEDAFPDMLGSFEDEGYWLRSWSNETYLWYDEIIDLDPALYATSKAGVADYFALLKTTENTPSGNPKDRFHYTRDTAEYEAESEQGVSAGYGASYALVSASPPRELVITLVESGSPAAEAGLSRGARIVTVDGVDLMNGSDTNTLNSGLWPAQIGEEHNFEVIDPGADQRRAIAMISTSITIDPVPLTEIISTDSGSVGYLLFTQHILPAEEQLVDSFAAMRQASVTDLVLDLRYNRGGYLYLANQVSYMIAGAGVSGRTFGALQFNSKNPSTNPVTGEALSPNRFITTTINTSPTGTPLPTLDLPIQRVFVLTTASTCSASEAIINGLRGVDVEVIQIGTTTCGKPYGFYPEDNCGTTYFTTQFRSVNAAGFGDYPDGFSPENSTESTVGVTLPGCLVADDYSPLGVAEEPMLAAALAYRRDGACPAAMASQNATSRAASTPRKSLRAPGMLLPPAHLGSQMWMQPPES
jgi:C-terminal processing protease CtpA/Prc